jgi:hypothetical protein
LHTLSIILGEEPQVFVAHFDFGPHAFGQHCRKPDTAIILR